MDANDSSTMDVRTREEVIGLTTFTALILVLAIPANALVLLAYLTSSAARRKPSNYLLVNFTISEFITALLVIPLQLVVHIIKPSLAIENGSLCKLVGVLSYPFYIISVGTMVCISIDRLYAIRTPLSYRSKMTAKRIVGMVAFTWVHGATFTFVFGFVDDIGLNEVSVECGILWRNIHMAIALLVAITHIVLPFVLLALLNYHLVMGLRKQNHTLESHFEQHVNVVVNRVGRRKNKARQAQERKVSCMVLWIITTYLICWIPYLVTRILYIIPVATSPLIDAIAVLILHLSVVVNPVLNLTFRKELRCAIERLFRPPRGGNVSPVQCGSRIFISDATTLALNTRNNSKPG